MSGLLIFLAGALTGAVTLAAGICFSIWSLSRHHDDTLRSEE